MNKKRKSLTVQRIFLAAIFCYFFLNLFNTAKGEDRKQYRKCIRKIIELNKQCSKIDKLILEREKFVLVDHQSFSRGKHPALVLNGLVGDLYLFKESEDAKIEEVVSSLFKLAGVWIPANYQITLMLNGKRVKGSIQNFITQARGLASIEYLNSQQLEYIQKHQVLDWLYGNFDNQFLIKKTGEITSIDKDGAFWGQGLKRLTLRENCFPGRACGWKHYNDLWAAYKKSVINLDLYAVFGLIDFLENLEEEFVIKQCFELLKDRLLWLHLCCKEEKLDLIVKKILPLLDRKPIMYLDENDKAAVLKIIKDFLNPSEDIEVIHDLLLRKRNLKKDFINFYSKNAQIRKEKFLPPSDSSQAGFEYAQKVLRYLENLLACRKEKLRAIEMAKKRVGKNIEVVTSGLGRYYLFLFFRREIDLKSLLEKLRLLKKESLVIQEKIALSIYLLVLENGPVKDKFKELNDLSVLDPKKMEESWIEGLYFKYKGKRDNEFFILRDYIMQLKRAKKT